MEVVQDIKNKLLSKGLRVTPQRLSILEAIYNLNHPVADDINRYIKKHHPNIAVGTVYKVLGKFVEIGLIKKMNTEKDVVRYDGLMETHHHIFSSDSQEIEDYIDGDLDKLLRNYFEKKKIKGFSVEEISLEIKGRYGKKK